MLWRFFMIKIQILIFFKDIFWTKYGLLEQCEFIVPHVNFCSPLVAHLPSPNFYGRIKNELLSNVSLISSFLNPISFKKLFKTSFSHDYTDMQSSKQHGNKKGRSLKKVTLMVPTFRMIKLLYDKQCLLLVAKKSSHH